MVRHSLYYANGSCSNPLWVNRNFSNVERVPIAFSEFHYVWFHRVKDWPPLAGTPKFLWATLCHTHKWSLILQLKGTVFSKIKTQFWIFKSNLNFRKPCRKFMKYHTKKWQKSCSVIMKIFNSGTRIKGRCFFSQQNEGLINLKKYFTRGRKLRGME